VNGNDREAGSASDEHVRAPPSDFHAAQPTEQPQEIARSHDEQNLSTQLDNFSFGRVLSPRARCEGRT